MAINKKIKLNKVIQILLLFLFVVNVSGGLFSPILAVFVTNFIFGATLKTVGFAVALFAVAKSIVQIPLARRLDKKIGEKDDFYVMLIGGIISILYAFGFIFIKSSLHLYILSAIGGIGAAFLLAAYYGIFARHVDRGSEGFEWSLYSTVGLTISVAIGSAIGGILADTFGFKVIFLMAGFLSVLATFLLLFLYPFLKKKDNKI
ncbi:MAG: MFS transporter [bacterium]